MDETMDGIARGADGDGSGDVAGGPAQGDGARPGAASRLPGSPDSAPGEEPFPTSPPRSAREATFLAEASRLLANSLDYDTTLSTVAGLALPALGSWCIVDVAEPNGDIRRVAIVHPDPGKAELANELREGWPPARDDRLGIPMVARSLEPEIITHVSDDFLMEIARNERNRQILMRLGIGSIMTVPLAARGDVLGAMTFVSDEAVEFFHDHDLALAEDLANRAAIAIDNARLYRMSRDAQKAAELASRAKSQFLGVMSHELRTPINAILGYTQLLDMGVKGPLSSDQRALLARVDASGRHLLELVTRVLDVSRAEAGELSVSNDVYVVDDVIASTLQIIKQKQPEGAHIGSRCDGDHQLRFLGDGIRVRQILVELVSNAFRFGAHDGDIVISCHQVEDSATDSAPFGSGPWVRIDVSDRGKGIPADRAEAVFEPFVQGNTDPFTRETDGSGLGLAVSRYLARLMGGDLTVASEPGKGSTFSLWLAAPREGGPTHRDRRAFDRDTQGLPVLADHLLRRLKPIVEAYVDRLRRDGAIPRAAEADDVQLRNHIPHFIAGLANLLAHAATSDEDVSHVLRGGTVIQRTTLELHGAQRHQLGWSPEALRHDLDLLRRTIHHDVRVTAPPKLDDITAPLLVLDRLFEQAEHISIQGWKHAQRTGGMPAPEAPGRYTPGGHPRL